MSSLPISPIADPDGAHAMGLHELPRDVEAEVVAFRSTQAVEEHSLMLRLLEIGFVPGERVRIIAKGQPGADPLAVRVGHTTFALRRHEASLVQVRVLTSSRGLA